jgi:hypothetical protein
VACCKSPSSFPCTIVRRLPTGNRYAVSFPHLYKFIILQKEQPVYQHVFGVGLSYLEDNGVRVPVENGGGWILSNRATKLRLFVEMHPDPSHGHEFGTFAQVLDDLNVRLSNTKLHIKCPIHLLHMYTRPMTDRVQQIFVRHEANITAHDSFRSKVFAGARRHPDRTFAMALDHMGTTSTFFPQMDQQLSCRHVKAHIGGLDTSDRPDGKGYLTFNFGSKDSDIILTQVYFGARSYKKRHPSGSQCFVFLDGASENQNRYLILLVGIFVALGWFSSCFLFFSVPDHSKFWIDRWLSLVLAYISHYPIRSL